MNKESMSKSKNPLDSISNFSQLEYELTKSIIFNQIQVPYSSMQYYLMKCMESEKEDNAIIDKCIKEFSYRDDFVRCYYIYSNFLDTQVCDTKKRFYFIIKKDDFETTRQYFRIFENKDNTTLLHYNNIETAIYAEDEENELISWLLIHQNYKVYERNGEVKVVMNNETNIK